MISGFATALLGVQGIEEAGTRLAQTLTKKESIAKMKASMAPEIAKSLARVSGGLYVITAANKSARGAMLASWVAQASFEPLGLTVAVAKDRAIESLMQVGFDMHGFKYYSWHRHEHFLHHKCCLFDDVSHLQ